MKLKETNQLSWDYNIELLCKNTDILSIKQKLNDLHNIYVDICNTHKFKIMHYLLLFIHF